MNLGTTCEKCAFGAKKGIHQTRQVNFSGIAFQFLGTRCRDVQSDCGEVIADIRAS